MAISTAFRKVKKSFPVCWPVSFLPLTYQEEELKEKGFLLKPSDSYVIAAMEDAFLQKVTEFFLLVPR
jgi:hypothetical protein